MNVNEIREELLAHRASYQRRSDEALLKIKSRKKEILERFKDEKLDNDELGELAKELAELCDFQLAIYSGF